MPTTSFNTPPPSPCPIPLPTSKKSIKPKQTSKDLLISEYADTQSPLSTIDSHPRPKIHPVAPNLDLLSRLNSFLPQLQQSNHQLLTSVQTEGNQRFDIEHVTPGLDRVIEMKLGLGLFQAQPVTTDTELPKLHTTTASHNRPLISDLSCDYTEPDINQADICSPQASLNEIVDQFYNSPFDSGTDGSLLSDA